MIPREAVTLENFQRMEKGLPPIKEVKPIRKEPKPPKVQNQIFFVSLDLNKIEGIEAIKSNVKRNEEGTMFIGYNIIIKMKGEKSLEGWIGEGDLYKLLPYVREKGKTDRAILENIGY